MIRSISISSATVQQESYFGISTTTQNERYLLYVSKNRSNEREKRTRKFTSSSVFDRVSFTLPLQRKQILNEMNKAGEREFRV